MPQDVFAEVARLALAVAIVAAFALPVAVVLALVARRPVVPRWRRPLAPPNRAEAPVEVYDFFFVVGFLFAWFGYQAVVAVGGGVLDGSGLLDGVYGPRESRGDAATQLVLVAGSVAAVPVVLACWLAFRAWAGRRVVVGELAADVVRGVAAWAVLTPAAFAVYGLTLLVQGWVGVAPEEHPLAKLGGHLPPPAQVMFGLGVCLAAPLAEEVLFRGLLVGWASGRRHRSWVLAALAVAVAVLTNLQLAPVAFAAALATVLVVVRRRRFTPAVVASAALFAAAHSAVWPSPVPLFVLGLGLGYLCLRTGGIAACVVVHGLFNAVSFVYLLRGGAG